MAQLKYYYDLMSQPCRAVYIFLKANKIPYEDKVVALRKGEHMTEDFKKLQPFSRVPFIIENDFVLAESPSIMKYISCKYNLSENWYPRSDLRKAAKVDEFLHWQHVNLRLNAAMIFQHLFLIPKLTGKPVNERQLSKLKNGLKECVKLMETYFLNGKPYLCGEDISIADLLGVCELMQLYAVHEEHFYTENRMIKAWVDRVRDRVSPHFDDAHKIILRARDSYSKIKASL